jgi:broad specificity phosphatase PhoE
MKGSGNQWGDATFRDDPALRDSELSETGKKQVRALTEMLLQWRDDGDCSLADFELIVVSPLTRCLQTYVMGVRPALEKQGRRPRVVALPLAAERVYTASDHGRPVVELAKEYPDIDWSLAGDRTGAWWYEGEADDDDEEWKEWRPHGQGQYYAVKGEPADAFARRMHLLQKWLSRRPEKCILLVGHWGVLRHLTGGTLDLDFCALCRVGPETL